MSAFFLKTVNMSIAAGWLVLAVLLLRLVLKKAPKWVRVLLWGLVAVRLVCPFTVESALSLIPSAQTVSPDIMMDRTPQISTGIGSVDTVINPIITQTFAPQPLTSANPLQILIPVAAVVWLGGIGAMLLYTAVSYFLLRRKVATAVLLRNNIYQSENVDSPFVLGILKPKIYLPFQVDGKNLEHVIAHEAAHIRRKDHWWKPFGFVLLALHWFNPLMWLGYILLCRDIELACDEKVIREMDNENRADYTQALVACSVNRRSIAACPLAFGEVGIKERVKSVMNYRKPAFWIVAAAVVTCIAVAVCFLTNPIDRVCLRKLKNDEVNMPGILEDITSMVVTYEGASVACPEEADVNRFLATLDKIDVRKEPISLNRSEDRSKSFTIQINTNTELHFNESFTEFWVDDHVKPSLSHGITNPETAKELLLDFNFTDSSVGGAEDPTQVTTTRQLTLEDVLALSKKGYDLGWSDFEEFTHCETGSGLYIRSYEINEIFRLLIGGSAMPGQGEAPMYIYLTLTNGLDQKIDIRDGAVAEFISSHNTVAGEGWDLVPMVRVNGVLYLDTGLNSDVTGRCGVMDGEIASQVERNEKPAQDDQSNFGTGYGYQYGAIAGTVELYMNGDWRIFATEQIRQQLQMSQQHTLVADIDKAVTEAILERNAGDRFLENPSGYIPVESHYMLGMVSKSGTPLVGLTNHMEEVTVYVQYAYRRYVYSEGKLESIAGTGTPAMITFSRDADGGYACKDFWEPNGGSLYAEDIRKMFPEDIADMLLGLGDDRIHTEELEANCLTKAQEYAAGLAG